MKEQDWNKKIRQENYDWMSDDQWECFLMVCDLMGGHHHVLAKPKPCGRGIELNMIDGRWATYDFDFLTKLVVYAHNRIIRAEICGSGPGRIKLKLHKRHKREGRMYEKHPTIFEVAEQYGTA